MIIAEVVPENGFVFLKFVEPGEKSDKKPYITLNSMEEAERRISFKTRMYIIEKLTAWLNQRREALPGSRSQVNTYLSWIFDVKLRSLSYICDFVHRRRNSFESIAPTEKSQFHDYYESHILTILNYCTTYTETANKNA